MRRSPIKRYTPLRSRKPLGSTGYRLPHGMIAVRQSELIKGHLEVWGDKVHTVYVDRLKARKPLRRSGLLRRRTRDPIPPAVTAALKERSEGRCEWCNRSPAVHRHHRLKRSQGGPHTPANLRHLCIVCHLWTEHEPAAAMKAGLILTRADARAQGIIP